MRLLLTITLGFALVAASAADAAQFSLRYIGLSSPGQHAWQVLLQPDQASAAAVEIGMQFTGGSILSLQPNLDVFDDANPGQNPFTGTVTIGASVQNSGAAAFAALGGVIPAVQQTLVMTVMTNGPGTLSLGGQNHNGFFTGARVWQGATPVNGLTASLQVTGTEADFNQNGVVDGADFLIWQRGSGLASGATRALGDANADGAVNQFDLNIWRGQYGATTSPPVAAVPEPATLGGALLAAASFLPLARKRRR
ncbi:dockerin type I domain-containing protein [Lacipirellula parvula]|uniref:PEP-CTERM protein-sorting domain-containing protein n=1 Tax=Lacipirellula parvula TaxID=2650471 RepID=A0A5K7XCN2_9BACT|nr:dockerin type I domain-containing protein [Lacipirellula parvula]BBO33732.1 hypothetical protein PLANPX_3344 [Lacipirellula parvula]